MRHKNILSLTIVTILFLSCGGDSYNPKPKGYFRIDLPEKSYHKITNDCPFTFEIPDYTTIEVDPNSPNISCWFNIVFTDLNASVYISYKDVDNNLNTYLEDSRTLAFKHTVKAFDIEQRVVMIPDKKVYGLEYNILGDAASSYQFHLTDSINHFIRGSLYFNSPPNQDSISPVLNFIKEDIQHLFKTFEWKE